MCACPTVIEGIIKHCLVFRRFRVHDITGHCVTSTVKSLELINVIFKNPLPTSQKTIWLILFKKSISVF
jgi:hypothetical protein